MAIDDKGQEIKTDFSFSIVHYEEKNIHQHKKLQKANHSVINIELKDFTGQQKEKEKENEKYKIIASWFTIKEIKINQSR